MLKIIKVNDIFIFILLLIISLLSIGPLIFIIIGMTNDSSFVFNTMNNLYFGKNFIENFSTLSNSFDVPKVFLNSLFVAFANALLGISLMFLAAYAFAIYDFKGKKLLFIICIITMMIPGNVIIINKFRVISMFGLKNSYLGLILPTVVNIHVLLLLVKNIEYLNKEVLESARIDGANELTIMLKVGFPAVFSYIIIGFFNMFVHSWNNFLLPLLTINTEEYFTLPIMISSIADPLRFKFGAVFVGAFIAIVPVVILLIIVSKYIFRKMN